MMKNKPKNFFKIATATLLGLSVGCMAFVGFKPILSRADYVDGTVIDPFDSVQDSGVTFGSTIFDYFEFDVAMSVYLDQSGILDDHLSFVTDFVSYLPYARTSTAPDAYSNWGTNSYTEDTPSVECYSSHGFSFSNVPPYSPDDGDIPDDEVTNIVCTNYQRMSYIAGVPQPYLTIKVGKSTPNAIYCNDLPQLITNLQSMHFIRFGFLGNADVELLRSDFYLDYLYFDSDNQLQLGSSSVIDYLSTSDLPYFPDLGSDILPDECFLLNCHIFLEYDMGQSDEYELSYDILFEHPMDYIHSGNDYRLLDSYIKSNQTAVEYVVPSPTEMLFNPIEVFLKTEFIDGFSFGTLLLVSLGFLAFWLFLKVFAGG